jgi:hypothetical protein
LTIGIRSTDPMILNDIGKILPFGWRPCRKRRVDVLYSIHVASRRTRLWRSSELLAETHSAGMALEILESSLAQTVAEQSRTDLFVHAGVVSWNGGAIIIPGRSHSGKSTLVAALVRAGAGYLSDEYAIIDSHGRVRPFARRLALRRASDGRKISTPAQSLGGRIQSRALPVSVVLVTSFRKNARFRPRPLSGGEVLLALLANTVPARTRPRAAMSRLRQVASAARGMKGTRGEADDVVRRILA